MLSVFKEYLQAHTPITDAQFETLSAHISLRAYPKGRILIKPGDQSGNGFFVCQGLLRAFVVDEKGKDHIIQFAPENWWINDRSSMFFNQPATLFIDVIEESQVAVIDRNFMELAQDICPEFSKFNIYLLHNFIRNMQTRICMLLAATAEERYLSFVELYPNVLLRVPQLMVASYLGITPESLSRVRKELARKHQNK